MMQHAGFDVSVRETAICVVGADGKPIWEGKGATSVGEIHEALRQHSPALAKAGMETGRVAVWLRHGLRDVGMPLDCIHARRAAAALKLQTIRTDRNDVRGLAQRVRSGWYEPVVMKSLETHRVRAVLAPRDQLVRTCTALISKIRRLAKTFGIIIGPGKGGSIDRAVHEALPEDPMLRDLFGGLLETLGVLRARRRLLDRQRERIARSDRTGRLLMAAPGVGSLAAIAFARAVEDPTRFRKARDVGAYPRLTPKRHQSGEVDIGGRISKCGDRLRRRLLFEAAGVILYRTKSTSHLRSWAQAIALRSGNWKARVALARTLGKVLFRMLRDGATFEPAPQAG